jgi:exosortase/archaeosortase family protein
VPTAAGPYLPTPAIRFAVRAVAWSLGLFSVLRLGWLESHAILPLTQLQGRIAERGFGAAVLPIDITLACSGADALALCTGAILGYPATWRLRLAGATVGIGLVLTLNTVRIGTLGRAAASPSWFAALHLYVWPALLMLAIASYVFAWMRFVDTRRRIDPVSPARQATGVRAGLTRPFVVLTAAFVVLFIAASPLYLESAAVLAVARFITHAAATALTFLGVESTATGNILSTPRGAFLVTQECISTPLVPVYLAAAIAYTGTWGRRTLALLAAAPLFIALGIARLLVVALPAALVGSPTFFIHAFYQVLLAGVIVLLAAAWRHGAGATAWRRAGVGAGLGGLFVCLPGSAYTRALESAFAGGPPLDDPQGALALLPAFQIGLYIALSVAVLAVARWQRCATGLAVLGLSQIAAFAALHFVVRQAGLTPHVRDVRAWALAGPLLVIAAIVPYDRPRR